MENVTFIDITNNLTGEVVTHALIDHGNDTYTSMLKSTYDEKQAAQNGNKL